MQDAERTKGPLCLLGLSAYAHGSLVQLHGTNTPVYLVEDMQGLTLILGVHWSLRAYLSITATAYVPF